MSITRDLAKEAKRNNICAEWLAELKNTTDIDKLIKMYLRGIDFCLSNNYPSNDYIRNHFKGKMEAHGVHLDENLQELNEKVVVALGSCTGNIEIAGYNTAEIFVKNDSKLNISVSNNAFVVIDVFDNCVVAVTAADNAKVVINRYGGYVSFSENHFSKVKLIEKNKQTY